MKYAIGYVRVSTTKQVNDGVSIDAQKDKIRAWCHLHDYELISIYEDAGISGSSMKNRQALLDALSALKQDHAFVCFSLSRLSRRLEDMLHISNEINKVGADLISLSERIDTTVAAGKMVFNMLAVLNQFERDQISERTQLAMNYLRNNNMVYSHTPYGYDRSDKNLITNDIEQNIIRMMQEYRESGWGYRKISTRLNKANIRSKHGGIWYPKTVKQVLDRN